MRVEHLELGRRGRVADRDPGGEPVALRLGQRVGPLHLDRVLRRDHHERPLELVGGAVDGDVPLFHALEHRRLGLGRGPVDLVADHDVREHRPRLELELAPLLVVGADPGDVARQQVGGELDPPHRAVDGPRERLGEHGLAHAGHVLDEQVPLGEQDDQREPDRLGLPVDDRLDGRADLPRGADQVIECPRAVRHRPRPVSSTKKPSSKRPGLPRGAGLPGSPLRRRRLRRRLLTVCRAATNAPRRTPVPLRNLSNRVPGSFAVSPSYAALPDRRVNSRLPNGCGFRRARPMTPRCAAPAAARRLAHRAPVAARSASPDASLQPHVHIFCPASHAVRGGGGGRGATRSGSAFLPPLCTTVSDLRFCRGRAS